MLSNCTAIVLTGGNSTRMGSDKANVLLNGVPLLELTLQQLRPIFKEIIVSSHKSRLNHHEAEILDIVSDCRGPILGIISSLMHIKTEWAFVIGCDMPFAQSNLIRYLHSHTHTPHDAIVPIVQDKAQPLFAFYKKQSFVKLVLQAQQRRCSLIRNLEDALDTYWINEEQLRVYDARLISFIDIDTPAELKHYQEKKPHTS